MPKKGFVAVKKAEQKAKKSANPRAAQFDEPGDDMPVDSRHYFAFTGFDQSSDRFEIFEASRELVRQLLGEFSLEVRGTATYNGGLSVAVEYYASQGEKLESKLFELRDSFKYQGTILFLANVEDEWITSFVKPVPHLPGAAAAAASHGPSSPKPAHGINSEHSGWTPDLHMRRKLVNDVLKQRREAPAPLELPLEPGPGADQGLVLVLSKLSELTTGVNELRANQATAVTRSDLEEFHERASQETRALVLSQTDPIKESVTELLKSDVANFERVGRLETRVEQLEKKKEKSGPDLSFQKLAVLKFPEKVCLEDRLESMRKFMDVNFPKVHVKAVHVIHRGEWRDRGKNREMTAVGMIDVGDADIREHIVHTIERKKLHVTCAGKELKVTRAMTENAKDRNTALRNAADLLKKQAAVSEKDVEIIWESRCVKVKGTEAFKQPSGRALGSFSEAYAYLSLP